MTDWQKITKAEKKEHLETAIAAALDEIERADREPDKWESEHLFTAIHAAIDGLFDISAHHLDSATKETISQEWHATEGLGNLTAEQLRTELDRLKYQPTQERAIFMR